MTGTEKQIQWATEIQNKFSASAVQVVSEIKQDSGEKMAEVAQDAVALLMANEDASWWISNRYSVSVPDQAFLTINNKICAVPELLARIS